MQELFITMEKKDHDYCLRCGRRLKNPEARERGYGTVCFKKLQIQMINKLFGESDQKQKEESLS